MRRISSKGLQREGAGSRDGLLGKPCFRVRCGKQWEYRNLISLLLDCVMCLEQIVFDLIIVWLLCLG